MRGCRPFKTSPPSFALPPATAAALDPEFRMPKVSLYETPELSSDTRHVIAALVSNQPGVLAGIAGMFAARGFNIDSLVVGRTNTEELSRMTIVSLGNEQQKDQIVKQLASLVPVWKVVNYEENAFVERDLLLIKVRTRDEAGKSRRGELIELKDLFSARAVDISVDQMVLELSGTPDKLEAFIKLCEDIGIIEMARTGVIAMSKVFLPEGMIKSEAADDKDTGVSDADLPPG